MLKLAGVNCLWQDLEFYPHLTNNIIFVYPISSHVTQLGLYLRVIQGNFLNLFGVKVTWQVRHVTLKNYTAIFSLYYYDLFY